jgi:hypothetical protein
MLFSWLRSRPAPRRPAPRRLEVERLDERIVPAAHFNNASDSITSAGALVASFKEAGLGDTTQVNYELTATATGTYVYVNKGGNLPQSPQFTTIVTQVNEPATFTSGKNGSITGTITAQPPPAPQSFIDAAPNGLHAALFSVSYTNVTLTDTTFHVSVSLADQSGGPFIQSKH